MHRPDVEKWSRLNEARLYRTYLNLIIFDIAKAAAIFALYPIFRRLFCCSSINLAPETKQRLKILSSSSEDEREEEEYFLPLSLPLLNPLD